MDTTLYWHDYETSGEDPRRDRPVQFAGVRTDTELNIIGDPLTVYCRMSDEVLPKPGAAMVTGITPQETLEKGVIETEFMDQVLAELGKPGTCGVGYNSIRFDDEVTRCSLYRNFQDPYAREWQNGNSRWDIIDMVRLTHALRPEGINWPQREDGAPSFRLEDLSVANDISHESAHDALSDVYATIGIARLIRDSQPKLYDYVFKHRSKRKVAELLPLRNPSPVLHITAMYRAEYCNTGIVVPVARHPQNANGIIVYDLRHDPAILMDLGVEQIRERLFTPAAEMPEDMQRIPLKTVHINKCPVIVPLSTLDGASAERTRIDLGVARQHLDALGRARDLEAKIQKVFTQEYSNDPVDVDLAIYQGFLGDEDKRRMRRVHQMDGPGLAESGMEGVFHDPRLNELFFRYRARNYPDSLSPEERVRWQEFRAERFNNPDAGGGITLEDYYMQIETLRGEYSGDTDRLAVLDALVAWGDEQRASLP